MVIDLEQYRKTKRGKRAHAIEVARRYDEERMCVNWTPTRGISATFCYRDPRLLTPHLPEDLAETDVEDFLDRVHGLASQI
ncbi:MAG: hypothetical protein ACT4PS_10225 [Betaproteobacteria bacterium]